MTLGIESLSWQQHTVTAKRVKLGANSVTLLPMGGETITFPIENLVYISTQDKTVRVCYYRLVVSGGLNSLKQVSRKGTLVTLRQNGTGLEITINTRFHKPTKPNGGKHAG